MSYCRFSYDSDVYVYATTNDTTTWECCGCPLVRFFSSPDVAGMIAHLEEHIEAGHRVPDYALNDLKAEMADGVFRG